MSNQNQILLVALFILHSTGFPLVADDEKVTGLTVSRVTFNKGSYELVGEKKWVEKGLEGSVHFHYKEIRRDMAAVYLHDAKRNMDIILNLDKKSVMLGSGSTSASGARDLYVITAARAATNKDLISANIIGNKGVALIQKGEFDKGLKLVKKASIIEPEKPLWHMNYGSMLFTKGRSIIQAGNKKEGEAIFKEAETELLLAIKLFKEEENISKSQCYFLLGDAYFFVFEEREKAEHSYRKSLEHYPKHGGAMKAIKRFN